MEYADAVRQLEVFQGRIGPVAHIAGLGFDIGDLVHFARAVGVFDLPGLVVYADVLDLLLLADIGDDLGDIVPGVEHHGVLRAQPDGIGQPVGRGHDVLHLFCLLIVDIEIRPDKHRRQQYQAAGNDKFGYQAMTDFDLGSRHNRIPKQFYFDFWKAGWTGTTDPACFLTRLAQAIQRESLFQQRPQPDLERFGHRQVQVCLEVQGRQPQGQTQQLGQVQNGHCQIFTF